MPNSLPCLGVSMRARVTQVGGGRNFAAPRGRYAGSDPPQTTFPMRRWRLGGQRRAAPAYPASWWLICRPLAFTEAAGSLAGSARASALRRVLNACDGRRAIDARVVVVPLPRSFWLQGSLVALGGPSGEPAAVGTSCRGQYDVACACVHLGRSELE